MQRSGDVVLSSRYYALNLPCYPRIARWECPGSFGNLFLFLLDYRSTYGETLCGMVFSTRTTDIFPTRLGGTAWVHARDQFNLHSCTGCMYMIYRTRLRFETYVYWSRANFTSQKIYRYILHTHLSHQGFQIYSLYIICYRNTASFHTSLKKIRSKRSQNKIGHMYSGTGYGYCLPNRAYSSTSRRVLLAAAAGCDEFKSYFFLWSHPVTLALISHIHVQLTDT